MYGNAAPHLGLYWGPSAQEPARRPYKEKKQRGGERVSGHISNLKILAMNYFYDSKGCTTRKRCNAFGLAGMYESLNKFVDKDAVLKRVNTGVCGCV